MSASIESSTVLTLRPDVVVTTLENEAVLLDLATKFFYSVNGSGWAVVQLFECGSTMDDVRSRCRAWGLSEEAVEGEVCGFVDRLVDEGLLTAGERLPAGDVACPQPWSAPTLEKHKEPLQKIMISAFDPTLPLAE
jgi:hypothetical protein